MVGIEGAAISGVLNILAKKLAPLVIKQYSSIVGVTKDLQDLQGLVEEINCWLEKAGYKTKDSGELFYWLRQLKHVVYDVDDIVDEFHQEADKHQVDGGNNIVSKWLITKPKSFLFQSKAASRIKAIKERFAAIVKQRTDFSAIVNSLPDGHPIPDINRTARAIATLPIVDEASVRGRDPEKQEIISKLVGNNNQQIIKIVSVIGIGGCGKTTLAKLVFNDGNVVKKHFEVRIWVHVSQEFDVQKLVEKLLEAISGEKSERCSLQKMAEKISDKLTGKRYLLVLDDVWIEDRIQWEDFMVYIKDGAPGSSILLTTRSKKVAEVVESTDPFNLPYLSEADSWALFNQGFGMAIQGLDSEFLEVGREIVNNCGGVPLAIKVLAGILRDRKNIEEWMAISNCNLLDVEDKEHRVSACLTLSYFHLPSYLKQCFTMCSLFPKGYLIYKQQLIDQWIAHDMIRLTSDVDDLEHIGDRYFNSLVQVSFLQDVDEYFGGVGCKMHDVVLDLARATSCEEISTKMPEDETSSIRGYRYFSLIEQPRKLLPKKVFRNARAIYVDKGDYVTMFGKALKNAKHLHSIIVNRNLHVNWSTVVAAIAQVKNLKYLEISHVLCEALPEAISDIWSLQALHLKYSLLRELPESIGKLQKLRMLNLSGGQNFECLPVSIGGCKTLSSIDLRNCRRIRMLPNSIGKLQKLRMLNLLGCHKLECLPDSIGDCQMISTIDLSNCWNVTALPNSIGRNEKLRVLRLVNTNIKRLPSSITKLSGLECLDLHQCSFLVELPEGIGNLKKLHVLNLHDCEELKGMPAGIGQLSRLQKLGLFVVGKAENSARISELANVSRIGEELIIRGMGRVMEPHDAHRACLKQMTNLQRLNLEWGKRAPRHIHELDPELGQAVLDGLEPSRRIKELEIHGYPGRQYASWMQNQVGGGVQGLAYFPLLRVMKLYDFPNLKHLHGLVELPCLEELELELMPSLESISGGAFPSLVKLVMHELPSLGEVWMVAEMTMSDGEEGGSCISCKPQLGQVRVGNRVTYLNISCCPKLKIMPYPPLSLQDWELSWGSEHALQLPGKCDGFCTSPFSYNHLKKLRLSGMPGLRSGRGGWELLQHMSALESLEISLSRELTNLPESLGALRSLQSLIIRECNSLSSLPQSIGHLTSLQVLRIKACYALEQLPESLGELCSLRRLDINQLGLTCLPESMCRLTSLEGLSISSCHGLTSLPQGIEGLTALKKLAICGCPGLARRNEGDDLDLFIARIASSSIHLVLSPEENMVFKHALARVDPDAPDRWERVAAMLPRRTVADIVDHYYDVESDVGFIRSGARF